MFGAGPDPAGMTCDKIIKGYELNKLLASKEGGRSAKHRKNSAKRVEELQSFYDRCLEKEAVGGDTSSIIGDEVTIPSGTTTPMEPIGNGTPYPQVPNRGGPVTGSSVSRYSGRSSGFGGLAIIGLLIGGAGAYLLARGKKGKK